MHQQLTTIYSLLFILVEHNCDKHLNLNHADTILRNTEKERKCEKYFRNTSENKLQGLQESAWGNL